ncbi:TPA: PagK family vesicle-borne virulence factor [Salmonella enterica]|nr:phage virulence factor [Salmonella enterica]
MKHVKNVLLAMFLILPFSLYSALTIAADSQDQKNAGIIQPIQRMCKVWPYQFILPNLYYSMCRGY